MLNTLKFLSAEKYDDKFGDNTTVVLLSEVADFSRVKTHKWVYCIAMNSSNFLNYIFEKNTINLKKLKEEGYTLLGECTITNLKNVEKSFLKDDIITMTNGNSRSYYEIGNVYVYPEYRHNGLGTEIIKTVANYLTSGPDKDSTVVIKAACLIKEYPEKPDDDEINRISSDLADNFFEPVGFVNINDYCGFDFGEALVYGNNVTLLKLLDFYKSRFNSYKHI